MTTSSQIKSDGTLRVLGRLDEVNQNTISESVTYLRAAEFDEVTLNPLTNGLVKRQTSDGKILVANIFDEYNLSSFITSGLVSYLDVLNYPGSGTNWPDDSGNFNNCTLVNPNYNSGPPAYFNFNGVNYGFMGPILNKTAYTKCAMIYLDGYYSNNIISGRGDAQHAFWLGNTTSLQAGHNGNWYTVTGTTYINLNQWYFVSVTFDTTNGWKLYVNGVLDGSSVDTTTFSGSDPGECGIGAYQDENYFYGRIPITLVHNRVLDATEIQTVFAAFRGRFGI